MPLLGAYLLLAHYIACTYWAIALSEVNDSPLLASVNASAFGVVALDPRIVAAGDVQGVGPWGTGATEWLPTRAYMEYGGMFRFYLRALYL